MNDITEQFTSLYHPTSALIVYQAVIKNNSDNIYVEHFDIDKNGSLVNAHPLTVREAGRFSKALKIQEEKETCLATKGIIGKHILYLDAVKGKVAWFTPAKKRELLFTEKLGIKQGKASLPPLLWSADRNSLSIFALLTNRRPTLKTTLYNAPFFNIYESGNVCMGTVDVRIKKTASLEEFTSAWEDYFFNSYFSHLMADYNPIKGNCVSLFENLISTGDPFPMEVLKKSTITLKSLLQ